jgi:AraC family transcriptional regulator
MFALGTGESSGKIVKSFSNGGAIVSAAHYSVEECSQGMHYHENPHICFLFQGGDVESRRNRSYERQTGDVFFYFAGEKHGSVSRRKLSKHLIIEFGNDFRERYNLAETQIERAVRDNLDAKFLMLKIQQELLIEDDCSPAAMQTLLLNLFDFSDKTAHKFMPQWARRLEDLLDEKWNEPITLEELSAILETHPVTISKNFRRYFSCTLGEYLRKLKISKSLALIKNSEMSLTEIAFHCGFADQSHFTRNFKEMTGLLPKDFRRI